MREARVAVIAGLTLTVIALAAVLSHAPATVAGANTIPAQDPLGADSAGATVCQAGETLPRDTSAIAISLSAFHGPRLTTAVLSGGHVLTRGQQGSDWSGRTVTIPVKTLDRTVAHATICFTFAAAHEAVSPFGAPTSRAVAATDDGVALPRVVSPSGCAAADAQPHRTGGADGQSRGASVASL